MPRHGSTQQLSAPLGRDSGRYQSEPHIQALLTYVRRPAFHVVASMLAASFGLVWLIRDLDRIWIYLFHRSWGWTDRVSANMVWLLFVMLSILAPLALSIIFAMMLIVQLREHLLDWRSRIFPRYGRPHILAATLILGLTSVAISAAFSTTLFGFGRPESFPATLAVITTLITVMAWAGVRWSPAFGPLAVALLILAFALPYPQWFTQIASRWIGWLIWIGWFIPMRRFVASIGPPCCLLLGAAEILLLPWLLRTASQRSAAWSGKRRWPILNPRKSAPTTAAAGVGFPAAWHQIVHGVWARAWHRRRAVLPRGAAAWVGIVLCAILMLGPLLSIPHPEPTLILRSLLLATLTPGIVAAGIWRERWPVLGLESLFPGRRHNFAWESLLSMAMNFVEVWLAGAAAAVVAAALFHPQPWSFAAFGLSLVASALVQVLVLGVLFVLTPFRATIPYLVIMTLLMLAIASPFELLWAGKPDLSVESLLAIAVAEAALGAMLAIAGQAFWNAFELA